MNKIIAILTKKGLLSNGLEENVDLNIFNLEEDRVVGFETIKVENKDQNYFFSLLKSKNITLLYLDVLANEIKKVIEKIGVTVRFKDECTEDEFLNTFIFS